MSCVIQGVDSFIYWIRGATYKGGVLLTDEHHPFNPLIEFSNPLVHYTQEFVTTSDKLAPNIVFDKQMELGSTTVRCYFRDPFLLLTMFTHKTVPAVWTQTADVITGDFTNQLNRDKNIGVMVHSHDPSGNCKHVDMFFDGGEVTGYRLMYEQGNALFEEADIQFAEMTQDIEPVNIDDGFDDGSFDKSGAAEVSTVVCKAKADITNETYFKLYVITAAFEQTTYNIWFDVTGDGVFATSPGIGTDVKCDISGAGNATTVGVIVDAAISGISADVGAENAVGTVTITNVNEGSVTDIVDVDSGLTVAVTTQGKAAEVSTIVAKAANDITTGKYFTLQGISATWVRTNYHVWFKKDGAGADPAPTGSTAILVTITTDQTAQTVSDAITAAIDAVGNFKAINEGGSSTTIRVTNATAGDVKDIVDVDSGLTVAVITQGLQTQDGGWSNWDPDYVAASGQVALAKDCTTTWGTPVIPGIKVQRVEVSIGVPKNPVFTADSLIAQCSILGAHSPYMATVEGYLQNNESFAEFVATYANKTKQTFKLLYGTTKYIQFTNAFLFTIDPPGGLPPAGEGLKVAMVFKGGANSALSYSWTDDEVHDPSAHINHTDS